MGRQESLWPEAKAFKPERWLADDFVRPSPFVYPVFNAGPRTCLGQNMAYLEAKLALSTLYRNFRFRLVGISSLLFLITSLMNAYLIISNVFYIFRK